MPISPILAQVQRDPMLARNVVHWRSIAARAADYVDVPAALDPRLHAALRRRGIAQLYRHQAEAIEAVLNGETVVVVTPTASGKTLSYNLPVLHTLLNDPSARALYLFPTKALAQDQRHELAQWLPLLEPAIPLGVYDGDTPQSARRGLRASTRLLISNPDMLHTGILPHHTQWLSLWSNLRYIVIDEVHHYRGLFGSHFANLLRRVRRIARFYGSDPQIIAASATIANPGELVDALTDAELPTTVIDRNGAPSAEKQFLFWNPPPFDEQLNLRPSALLEARRIASLFLEADVQSILFTRSRLSTELLLRYLQAAAQQLALPEGAVASYRGGYLPTERRQIEQGLRDGSIRAVVTTNALELGIDIGQLDACLMVGYPGTIASTWQQAGRAGRRSGENLAILLATADPLDQFMVSHPDWFFAASPEHARINADNLQILVEHLKCACFELPFAEEESFGSLPQEITRTILAYLEEAGLVHSAAGSFYWTAQEYPAEAVSLRHAGSTLLITEQPGGITIGEVDRWSVHQMCFPGAIYMHSGRQFLVDGIDWAGERVDARSVEVDYYTRVMTKRTVAVERTVATEPTVGRSWGEVLVTSTTTGYKKIKLGTHETLSEHPLELPESTLQTTAWWVTFPVEVPRGHDYGPNWRQQRDLARQREGFRCADCRIAEADLGRELDIHHLIPFREFGYVAGLNDGYLAANELSNLLALCPTCHKRREPFHRSETAIGLQGVAHALQNIAPLFLLCDSRDLGSSSDVYGAGGPTIYLYDTVSGGIGFAEQLYRSHPILLDTVAQLIRDCGCADGCPACIGPEAMLMPEGRRHALALLAY
ncbi:MAG: DEAD/DEAH box helicase [Anaerolineales bacterium]|nr:DEAD/DEAH box helicase [Anaerolineales bacterium]